MRSEQQNREIATSHRRGFGGSDAALFAKIGKAGSVDVMSVSDIRRVLHVLGKAEMVPFGGNLATEAGHDFEEWMEANHLQDGFEREVVLTSERVKARNFDIFAHADFVGDGGYVLECKYSQKTTVNVAKCYRHQLQWYYMLGAGAVVLCHGWGGVFPFAPEGFECASIDRDNAAIDTLIEGIFILDAAISSGHFDDMTEEALTWQVSELEPEMGDMVAMVAKTAMELKELERQASEVRKVLARKMGQAGMLSVKGDGFRISYVAPSERRSFDTRMAQQVHPDLKSDMYYKVTNVSECIKVTEVLN